MSDGVGRPLAVLAVTEPGLGVVARDVVERLRSSPRVVLREVGERQALAQARRERPDVVLLASAGAGRLRLGLRMRGLKVASVEAAAQGADPVGVLAASAARPGAGLSSGPPVSVVATVLSERWTVDALVERVGAQLGQDDELVVLDGGSRDGTFERLEELAATRPWLRVCQAAGLNISAGRNAAIALARHEVVVTTDAGCAPAAGWLEGLRMPFAEAEPPGLVAGVPRVRAVGALQRAQAHACYPDPDELARLGVWAGMYFRMFGTGFDARVPFARSLAFTREAWRLAGGFPERLGWVEDGVFGTAVAAHLSCVATRHAEVTWDQRGSLAQTFGMYRRYGIGAVQSGDRALVGHDVARAGAYVAAGALALVARRRAVLPLLAGAGVYVSLPLQRAARHRAGPVAMALIPVALATKDCGKVVGAVTGRGWSRA